MTAIQEARAHLRKAEEFLDAAELAGSVGLHNAATANAVTSGINSKDAICLKLTGRTGKSESHADAVSELRRAGPATKPLATVLGRLLRLKNRSQYQTADIARADAHRAIEWARTLYDAAKTAVSS